ncbi:MAG: hypothetical protein HY876_00495 [Coriobacteriales bacterium]|nr:hypothetical protein [Coriobacteriales bacterium]
MPKQPAPGAQSQKRLVAALVAVLVAAAAFAAAFYAFDGMSATRSLLAMVGLEDLFGPDAATPQVTDLPEPQLVLPAGMPKEFALRIWQEQVESQANLERLAEGDVSSLRVLGSRQKDDTATLRIVVEFADGTSAPGELGMRRFGKAWYVAWVRGARSGVKPVSESDEGHKLPDAEDVDVELLSGLIASQGQSQAILSEYAAGEIDRADVVTASQADDAATLALEIKGADGEPYEAKLELVKGEARTIPAWFVSRFTRTDAK